MCVSRVYARPISMPACALCATRRRTSSRPPLPLPTSGAGRGRHTRALAVIGGKEEGVR